MIFGMMIPRIIKLHIISGKKSLSNFEKFIKRFDCFVKEERILEGKILNNSNCPSIRLSVKKGMGKHGLLLMIGSLFLFVKI